MILATTEMMNIEGSDYLRVKFFAAKFVTESVSSKVVGANFEFVSYKAK